MLQHCPKEERAELLSETATMVHRLHMNRFVSALMWVMQEIFHLQDELLIMPPNAKEGRFLLNEIMLTGNFGQYDERVSDATRNSAVGRNRQRLKRDVMLFRYFPEECLSEPFFRMYHWWWRKRMN